MQTPMTMHNTLQMFGWILVSGFLLVSCFAPEKTVTKDYEETFTDIKEIELDGRFLEVTYEGRSGDAEVYLNAYLEASESSGLEVRYRKSGSKLKIEVVGETSNIGWNFGNQHKGYISLTGPEDIKLNLNNNSGSLEVMNVTHRVIDLKVNSGSIKAIGLEVDKINMTASSGSIKGEGLTGDVKAQVNSGNISIIDVEGNVDAKTSSGSLKLEDIQGVVSAKANSGSMKFIKVKELGELTVTSGSIKAENSGLGRSSTFNANSGSITIQTNSDLEDFNFDLSANSGSVKVGDDSSGKKLNIDNGSANTVRGKVSSGSIRIGN
jgi:lia operon protein LiaG